MLFVIKDIRTIVIPSTELVEPVLARNPRAIARLITRAESGDAECRPALEALYAHTGRAQVVGMTGVAGSGKSTLLDMLTVAARKTGRTVAVVAVDPSSPYSGGSILGDRIRMNQLSGDPDVFIRSMATRGALGGLARATHDAVDLLDAAGFDMVFIETVGVGQDEVDVVRAAHTIIVVSAPGLGDDIQAIKAGLLEIADVHVVSKCDRSDAAKTIKELRSMLTLDVDLNRKRAWPIPVLATSSEGAQGVQELLETIDRHRESLETTGEIVQRRRSIAETRVLQTAEAFLRGEFAKHRDGRVSALVERVMAREIDPHGAAQELIAGLQSEN